MNDELIDLIAKIEAKAKQIEQYTYEKEAMEKRLYALARKAREDKRQMEIQWGCSKD